MKTFLPFLTFIVLTCLLACSTPAVEPTLSDISEADTSAIDSLLDAGVETQAAPGVVAIVADPESILYHGAFGTQDVANNVAMTPNSILRIASMTKPITSVAVMMLFEEGRFDLDDPISMYLPSYLNREVVVEVDESEGTYTTEPADSEVTIRQLLSNAGGFGYAFSNETMRQLEEMTGQAGEELPLLHQPGARWTYSMSTRILGNLIADVSGMPLDEFMAERVFQPLGMEDTAWTVPDEKRGRVATFHQREDGELTENANPENLAATVRGDGDLYSTAEDYVRFMQMFLNGGMGPDGRLLSTESITAMTSNQIGAVVVETHIGTNPLRSSPFPLGAGRDKFGLGFQIAASNDANPYLRSPGSYSWSGIYNTHFWVDPAREIAGAIFMQVLPFYDDACIALFQDFEELTNRTFRP